MKLKNQSHLFNLPSNISYLNTASYAPSFKKVEDAGLIAVKKKSHPYKINIDDFFSPLKELKQLFASIVEVDQYERITTIPSVSYGMATIANNICLKKTDEILLVEDQFPSNYYVWKRLSDRFGASLRIVKQPIEKENSTKIWNQAILDEINENTALVAMGQIHWSNGSIFDLKRIRQKTKECNSLLVIDGSQSVGALPFSIKEVEPDALVCAGYKWLFGPYGTAYAYYGPYFDEGIPIEENWIYREYSENFSELTQYRDNYKPLAHRYGAGQGASFIYVQMQLAALKELLNFKPKDIQEYCKKVTTDFVKDMRSLGCFIETDAQRSHHMFGVILPQSADRDKLKDQLSKENIFISFRGDYLRVSCHLFNAKEDFDKLTKCIKNSILG